MVDIAHVIVVVTMLIPLLTTEDMVDISHIIIVVAMMIPLLTATIRRWNLLTGHGIGIAMKVLRTTSPTAQLSILVNRKPSQQTRYITYAYFPWNRYWGLYTGWCYRKYCCTACTATLLF